MASSQEKAWAAGLIDGEGCIAVVRQKRQGRPSDGYNFHVTVCMVHLPALERLQDLFGGKIYSKGTPGPRRRQAWYWSVGTVEGIACLKQIRPYLVVKAEEADIALRFRETYRRVRFPKGGRPQENEQQLEQVYWALREAKRYEFTSPTPRVSVSQRRNTRSRASTRTGPGTGSSRRVAGVSV